MRVGDPTPTRSRATRDAARFAGSLSLMRA